MLAQILAGLSSKEFALCAKAYPMARGTPAFSAYDHFAVLVFAQLRYRESLREIEACLNSCHRVLYHSNIRGRVNRTNLACASEHRAADLFGTVTAVLMRRTTRLHADTQIELRLNGDLFAVDASLIKLNLAIFPWTRWQGTQAAVKLNLMLTVATAMPAFCTVVPGDCHDVHFMGDLPVEARDYLIFDRGYVDYARPVDKTTGLRCDQTIRFDSKQAC